MIVPHRIIFGMRNVSDESCRERQNTHFVFDDIFSANRSVYGIIGTKYLTEGEVTYGNTIWRMRFACWIPKATNIHSEYNTYWCSTATIVAPTLLNFRFCLSYCVLMRKFISSVFYQKMLLQQN